MCSAAGVQALRCNVCHTPDYGGQAAALYGVSDDDIKALAHFLARRPPRGMRP